MGKRIIYSPLREDELKKLAKKYPHLNDPRAHPPYNTFGGRPPLPITNPELVQEYFDQDDIWVLTRGSCKVVQWKCKLGHIWKSPINGRAVGGNGCKSCLWHEKNVVRSISHLHPDLIKEWHPNNTLDPSKVGPSSARKALWRCRFNHEWWAPIHARVRGTGCPFCAGRQKTKEDSLEPLLQKIVHTWDDSTPANSVAPKSNKDYWWRCKVGHRFKRQPANILSKDGGQTKCPYCFGRKVSDQLVDSFAALFPLLMEEWSPLNEVDPYQLRPGSSVRVKWVCKYGHQWETTLNKRTSGRVQGCVTSARGCPECAGKVGPKNNLAVCFPHLAEQWGENGKSPRDVSPGSGYKANWICSKGHTWKARVVERTRKKYGCHQCIGRTSNLFKEIIFSLVHQLDYLPPQALWAIIEARCPLTTRPDRQRVLQALINHKVTPEEVQDWKEGKPAPILDALMAGEEDAASLEAETVLTGDEDTEIGASQEQAPIEPAERMMRTIMAGGVAMEGITDAALIEYMVKLLLGTSWNSYFEVEQEDMKNGTHAMREKVLAQVREMEAKGGFIGEVAKRFLAEHAKVQAFKVPKGFTGKEGGGRRPMTPNSMQALIPIRVKETGRVLNYSGTGAGKTLSAVLTAKHLKSKLTIVVCPFNVMDEWEKKIGDYYEGSKVVRRTWHPKGAEFLILNYEWFQDADMEEQVSSFMRVHGKRLGLIVLDEVHLAKQREGQGLTLRREGVLALLKGAASVPRLFMSATPIINDLVEGANLIEMLTDENPLPDTKKTVNNCVELNRALVQHGVRWKPNHGVMARLPELYDATRTPPPEGAVVFDDPSASGKTVVRLWVKNIVPVDMTPHLEYIQELRRELWKPTGQMQMEEGLTTFRLDAIRRSIKPGEKVIIYTLLKGGDILETLTKYLRKDGHEVVAFTGEQDPKERKDILKRFKGKGGANVLICTDAMGTGIDELQYVCSKVIFNVLPWTHAQYEQLIGRVWRQGQKKQVEVIVPITYITLPNGRNWSYDMSKMRKIMDKRTLADAAIDGNIPDHLMESESRMMKRVFAALDAWSARVQEAA